MRLDSTQPNTRALRETHTFGELLIDLEEEDKAARAVVFGLLTEMER
jgi:hypothetical protein